MPIVSLLTVLLLSRLCLSSQSLVQPLRVYIDGAEGKDSLECLSSSSTETPCQSLSFVSENLTQKHFVAIEILGDVLNLTRAVNFTEYSNLTVSGSGNSTILHCNESGAGLAFRQVENLKVYSLIIKHCGAPRPTLPVAFYIFNCCGNVLISSVDIVSSNGTGLSLHDTVGVVEIVHCNFAHNSVVEQSVSGGGGVYIELTNHNSRYTIQNCVFRNNSAHSLHKAKLTPPSRQASVPRLGKGGGLYISLGMKATYNNFQIVQCMFLSNKASLGAGGMMAEFLNSVANNTVSLVETNFIENTCTQSQFSGGGGLIVDFLFYSRSHIEGQIPQNNAFECRFCTFQSNIASMGGGTAITAAKGCNASFSNAISFSNCNWTENESAMGAAVFITPGIWDYTAKGFLPVPTFMDCQFGSNSAIQTIRREAGVTVESVGYGALFVSQLTVMFGGRSYFGNSSGSAIHLSSAVVDFAEESHVTFFNNTSHNGGAIAMYGSSMIQIRNSSTFLLTDNGAISKGGAIYSEFNAAAHPAYHNCFISSPDFSQVNSTFVFRGNSAKDGGASIFTTTFQSCGLLCSDSDVPKSPEYIMKCIAKFNFDKTDSPLSTRPDKFYLTDRNNPLKLIPGAERYINLTVLDESNNNLSGIVYAAFVPSQNNISIDAAFRQVSNNRVKVRGRKGSTAKLQLFTADISVSLNISLTECQPGHHYSNSSSVCECASSQYFGLEGCDPNVYLKQGYWVGYCSGNGNKLCTAFCPYGYCSYSGIDPGAQLHALHSDPHFMSSDICGPRRTNRLCGECSAGHSVYHNSWKHTCGSEELCHFGWFFYILSDILPLTLFFIIVLVFNISFTTGNTNCFVLYGQLLGLLAYNGNDSVQFSPAAKLIQDIVTYPYDYFNLNFFTLDNLSYCPWKGATFMGDMMMKYATVGFALALVLVTIFITRYRYIQIKIFFRFQHRNSVLIHGLSAFFIICYSKAVGTTFHILNFSCLYSANFNCAVKVVHQDGHMAYLGEEHAPYAIIAFVFLLFMVIMPPLLLLFYPLVFKLFGHCNLSESKPLTILWRMMPIQFLDAFQSSFKDKYRFFAGLYFLYRAAILALFVCAQSWLEFYSSVQLLLIFIMTVHFVVQPHKERRHNIVDSLLFANLSFINAITLFYYGRTEVLGKFSSEVLISALAVIQAVLIILPLLLGITLWVIEWNISRRKRKDYENLPSLRIDGEDSSKEF
jgi:predicted outer membrane repeat protein